MYFTKEMIRTEVSSVKSKTDVLKLIAEVAHTASPLKKYSQQQLFQALEERESAGSTGFGSKIAIPHCRLNDVDKFVMGVLVLKEEVDFDSVDGKPVKLIVFVFGPEEARTRHIKLLSEISRILMDIESYQTLLNISSPDELQKVFESYMNEDEELQDEEYRLIQIVIQNEDYFEGILEAVTAIVDGNLVILESENASHYLHSLPLFSSFWTENNRQFSRMIVAVSRRKLVNEIARRVNIVTEDLDKNNGVLMTSQPLSFVLGSLEI